jgi:ribose transport system substrate-binding protein
LKRLYTLMLTVVVLAGAAVAVLYFWNAGYSIKKGYTFELIVKGTDIDFWKSVNAGAQAAASTYDVNVSMIGPTIEKDYSQQVSLLEASIARRPDAIILAAADYNLLANPVQDAINKGIPVIMVDSDVDNPRTVAYVGTDNAKLGTALAKQMEERLGKATGEVGIVSFVKESYPAVQREKGFRSAMSSNRHFTLLDTAYGDSDVEKTEYLTANLIAQHPKLAAIASLNAQSSEGAAQALSKLGRKDIPLYAIDCTPEEAMYMEDGVLRLAILQNPYQMGYYGVETACRKLKGEKVGNRYTDIYPVDVNTLFSDQYQQLVFPFNS